MKGYSITLVTIWLLLSVSCGQKDVGSDDTAPAVQKTETAESSQKDRSQMTEEEKIMADMTEMIERLAEGDKSAMWDNEFSYYKADKGLTDYWKIDKVYLYKYDTLAGINFDSVKIVGDSARVWANLVYTPKAGGDPFEESYAFWMYKLSGDKWIKPYISVAGSFLEIEYLENLRRYREESGE